MSPPAMAPQMLPMPPTTMAEMPLSPSASPMNGCDLPIVDGEQHAGQRGEQAADDEDDGDDAVDIDAEQKRGVGVLGNGAQPAAEPGLRQQQRQAGNQRDRKQQARQAAGG